MSAPPHPCVLLTCKVWPKRFNGVAFTGGMRFASDVTLERGLTRLLLGSCRVKKKGGGRENVKVNYEDNITPQYSHVPLHDLLAACRSVGCKRCPFSLQLRGDDLA